MGGYLNRWNRGPWCILDPLFLKNLNEHSQTSFLGVKNRFFHKFVWELVENEKIQKKRYKIHVWRKYSLSKNNQGPHRWITLWNLRLTHECPKPDFVPKPHFYKGTPFKYRYRAFCPKKKVLFFKNSEGPRTLYLGLIVWEL